MFFAPGWVLRPFLLGVPMINTGMGQHMAFAPKILRIIDTLFLFVLPLIIRSDFIPAVFNAPYCDLKLAITYITTIFIP